MKFKLIITTVALLIAQSSYAASPQPTACPAVSAFQATGVSSAWQDPEKGTWVGVEWNNKFNTDF